MSLIILSVILPYCHIPIPSNSHTVIHAFCHTLIPSLLSYSKPSYYCTPAPFWKAQGLLSRLDPPLSSYIYRYHLHRGRLTFCRFSVLVPTYLSLRFSKSGLDREPNKADWRIGLRVCRFVMAKNRPILNGTGFFSLSFSHPSTCALHHVFSKSGSTCF